MTRGLLFWILVVVSLLFGVWAAWPLTGAVLWPFGGNLLTLILIVLPGWQVFGAPAHG